MERRPLTEIPTEDELNETFQGMTFEEFKGLSDEEVEKIISRWKAEDKPDAITDGNGKVTNDEYWVTFNETFTLSRFNTWRQYGVPDRNVTYDEVLGHLETMVEYRKDKDPDYGGLKPEQFQNLPQEDRQTIAHLFDYFFEMREPYVSCVIDDYSLFRTLGFEEADVERINELKILEHVTVSPLVGNVYELAQPYYDCWLVQILTERNSDASQE